VIVTRHRKKKSNPAKVLVPLAVVAALVTTLTWPPAHATLANGPLAPALNALAVVARPLTFAAQQQTITDRNRTIRDLNAQLERERREKDADDARIGQLQQQLTAAMTQPKTTPAPLALRTAPPARAALAQNTSAGATASDDERRIAATWAAMEPEKAAAVVQRLPDDEVMRVLALMDPDSAAAVLGALPPALAARLTRPGAQVATPSGR
jgi:flagellar motility protein MotE (MotC chaperone)